MIISPHEQGSKEWLLARTAVVTASEFSKILTPTGSPSGSAEIYRHTLLAEWMMGKPADNFQSEWMKRGNLLESDAAELYGFINSVEPEKIGLCYLDKRKLIGASPDRLVGNNGLLEIKCPKESTIISYLLKGKKLPTKYIPQVQGQLWITEREWCDFMVYHPDFEAIIIRVNRNERYIDLLSEAVNDFVDEMLEEREKLKEHIMF